MLRDEPPIDVEKRVPTKPAGNTRAANGMWIAPASVGAAVLSSACCWLPLLLLAFGLSAGGVAGFFESARLYFLVIAVVFLCAGFYFAYFIKPACKHGEACAVPNPRLQRLNRSMLWLSAVFVTAFALFPYYSPALLRAWAGASTSDVGSPTQGQSIGSNETTTQTYAIDGMTCRACAATLEVQLGQLPGVVEARVSYEQAAATLVTDRPLERAAVASVVERAGFGLVDEEED